MLFAEAGADRVFHHVETDMLELFLVERSAPKSVTEDVSPAAILAVEPLGVVAVQKLHAVGEILAGRVEHQVVVVRHQAERVAGPLELVDGKGEEAEEVTPVVGVVVDRHLCHPTGRDVKETIRKDASGQPRHRCNLRPALFASVSAGATCRQNVTVSARTPCPEGRISAMSVTPMSGTVPAV